MIKNYNSSVAKWRKIVRLLKNHGKTDNLYYSEFGTLSVPYREDVRNTVCVRNVCGYCDEFLLDEPDASGTSSSRCKNCPLFKAGVCAVSPRDDDYECLFWDINVELRAANWTGVLPLAMQMLKHVERHRKAFIKVKKHVKKLPRKR